MTGRLPKKARAIVYRAALGVLSAVIKTPEACKGDGARTHGARLQRDIEVAIDQPFAPQAFCRRANGQNLGMGGWVLEFHYPVAGFGQNLPIRVEDHRSHWHFAPAGGGFCLRKGGGHGSVCCLIGAHGRTLPRPLTTRQAFLPSSFPGWRLSAMHPLMTDNNDPSAETPEAAKTPQGERIAKVLARAGVCSRRDAERMIEAGRISVNGVVLTSPALNVTSTDKIIVDGKPLPSREPTRLWRYHKPRGKVTTARDPEGRPTVFDALPEDLPRVISIGRLDVNTEGLLLLTNDGELARKLELPSTGWARRYRVRAYGRTDQAKLDALQKGIEVDGIRYGPIQARLERDQGTNVWINMTLREGKNREIKRVLEKLGLDVNRLIRTSYGPFQLGDLAEGVVQEVPERVLMDQLGETDRQKNADQTGRAKKKSTDKKTPGTRGTRSGGKKPFGKKPTGKKPDGDGPAGKGSSKKTSMTKKSGSRTGPKSGTGKNADRRR